MSTMSAMPCRIIVMAKAPLPGQAKTRLQPALGADGAARLAERLLRHTVDQALQADLGLVTLCGAPDATHPAFADLLRDAPVQWSEQGEGDLGQRMARALGRALADADRALLIGTDAPALDAAYLRQACHALATHEAVFGPAFDGGYVLVGLQRPPLDVLPSWLDALFGQMAWSTPQVMGDTRERLAGLGLRHAELSTLHDIDEPADLEHLPATWQDACTSVP